MVHRGADLTRRSVFASVVVFGTIGLLVTAAGVAVGALVLAPMVATRGSQPDNASLSAPFSTSVAKVTAAGVAAARDSWQRLDQLTGDLLAALPEPVARYLLPTIAIVSIGGAVLVLVLPSRMPTPARRGRSGTDSSFGPRPTKLVTGALPFGQAVRTPTKRHRSPKLVETLAASGTSTSDIAWKTGLPIDAVRLLLAISSGPRQVHPPTA